MPKPELDNYPALRAALEECLKNSREARLIHKLHCLLLCSLGVGIHTIAQCFHKTPRTLMRWIDAYRRFGMDGLHEDKRKGRAPLLNQDQQSALDEDLASNPKDLGYADPAWSGILLVHHLERKFAIKLGIRQSQRLLQQWRERQPVE